MPNQIIIVGDKFQNFAANQKVMTVSEFARALDDGMLSNIVVRRGQGVSDNWMAHIVALSETRSVGIEFKEDAARCLRASARSSHKIKRQNILISEPRLADVDLFEAKLLIDEDCELMGDHQTGHHVQGMLLIEAARQMFLATIERFLKPGHANYAVINYLNTSFSAFAFPVSTDIELRVNARDESLSDRASYDVSVGFFQSGKSLTVVEMRFTVFEAIAFAPKEEALAGKLLKAIFTVPVPIPVLINERELEALSS